VRVALLSLLVLAVVLPTALVPEHYSTRQVLSAFHAEGLPLKLTARTDSRARDGRISSSEFFFRSRDRQFSVVVFEPARMRIGFGWTGLPTKTAWRGNVVAYWTSTLLARGKAKRIRAALSSLGAYPAR